MGKTGAAAARSDAAPRRPVERPPTGDQRDPVADRTGAPWRDVPACYGDFRTLHGRHRRWSADGTWAAILARLQTKSDADAGAEWAVAIDSTVVRAHRHAAGARHAPPKDVPAEQLAPLLPTPTLPAAAGTAAEAGDGAGVP